MRHETIVEITPDGRAALRLVIVPDYHPEPELQKEVVIAPNDEDPFVVDQNIVSYEV